MNPSMKLFLILAISLEISFTRRLAINLIIICACLVILVATHQRAKTYWRLFIYPLLPAAVLAVSAGLFSTGHDWFYAAVIGTRIYAYVFLGAVFNKTTRVLDLARSLEQNCHVPSKYAYGVLAAFNLFPRIGAAIKTIRAAGRMRGQNLSLLSPTLYFKAILVAVNWSDQLAQAMESHGFVEDAPRTAAQPIKITGRDWAIVVGVLILIQIVIVTLR